MIGLVLWYNGSAGTGIIWCEDQGPLAFLGPEVRLPDGAAVLESGDQLVISVETREGVRFVRDIRALSYSGGARDPREIINGYHQAQARARRLSVVA